MWEEESEFITYEDESKCAAKLQFVQNMHFEWATVQDGPAHGHGHWLALYVSLGTACWSINEA